MYLTLWRTLMLKPISKPALTEQIVGESGEKGDADYNDKEKKRGDQRGRVASCSLTLLARSCLRLNFLNKIFSNLIFLPADQPLLLSCSPLSSQVMFYVSAFRLSQRMLVSCSTFLLIGQSWILEISSRLFIISSLYLSSFCLSLSPV
jgi:hypothetical protein